MINALSRRYFLQANDAVDLKEWVIALNKATKITVRQTHCVFFVNVSGVLLVDVTHKQVGLRVIIVQNQKQIRVRICLKLAKNRSASVQDNRQSQKDVKIRVIKIQNRRQTRNVSGSESDQDRSQIQNLLFVPDYKKVGVGVTQITQ